MWNSVSAQLNGEADISLSAGEHRSAFSNIKNDFKNYRKGK